MPAAKMSRLQRNVFFTAALWIAVGCGGKNAPDGPGTSSSNERARNNDPSDDSLDDGGSNRVTLCHIPPGNPANAHTITVGEPAVRAHLAHGDYLGPCHGSPGSDGSPPGPDGGPPGSNPDGGTVCEAIIGAACGPDLPACCSGLLCTSNRCSPALN